MSIEVSDNPLYPETPDLPAQEAMQGQIELPFNTNAPKGNCAIITDGPVHIAIEALSDQIIILEDKFKSGYECSDCGGDGYLDEPCDRCKGTGKESESMLCRFCCPRQLADSDNLRPGKKLCPTCEGKGGLLIAPQISQKRPTSGLVKSVGPDVVTIRVGDHVLYGMFAGTAINFKQKGTIRIMHEHEIMSRLYGLSKIGDWIR